MIGLGEHHLEAAVELAGHFARPHDLGASDEEHMLELNDGAGSEFEIADRGAESAGADISQLRGKFLALCAETHGAMAYNPLFTP